MSYFFIDGGGGWRYIIPYVQKKDTVIGSNHNINKFFKEFIQCNTINLKTPPTLYPNVPKNIITARKEYNKHFKHLKDEDIYLFGRFATITFFSYINKLCKTNFIHYLLQNDRELNLNQKTKTNYLYYIPMKLICKIMGVDLGITKSLGKPMWQLKENSIEKYNIVKYEVKEPEVKFPKEYKELLNGKDTLVLLNDLETLAVDPLKHSDMLAELLDFEKTIIKNHTRKPKIFGKLNAFDRFPSYVPAEIIFNNHKWKNIISLYISKTSLNPTKAKYISLYNLIHWKNPVTEEWIESITNKGTILPNTKKEFKELLC